MSTYEDNYDLGGRTLQLAHPDNSETHTDMLPLKACLSGWHQKLGCVRSLHYWTPRYLVRDFERWTEFGITDIKLEYAESGLEVFG